MSRQKIKDGQKIKRQDSPKKKTKGFRKRKYREKILGCMR